MRHCLDDAFSGQSTASWVPMFRKNLTHVGRNAKKDDGDLKLSYKRRLNQLSFFKSLRGHMIAFCKNSGKDTKGGQERLKKAECWHKNTHL